jgi:glycosyltransferase involved in cell wall biosynthesis
MAYFTVVIPTRNRPNLVPIAVQSVLEQDCRDFELIVSDNSDPDRTEETRAVLADALRDPRVRYIRPPRTMAMVDHWEWAVRQAQGEFTGVLADRMAYRLYALGMIRHELEMHSSDLISLLGDKIRGETPPFRLTSRQASDQATLVRCADVVAECARVELSTRLPRMLNSFCRTERLRELVRNYGSIFTGVAPDYAFCFRILDWLDSFLMFDSRLQVSGGESQSNGLAFTTNRMNADSRSFLALMEKPQEWFRYAPIPAPVSINNNFLLLEYELARSQQKSGRFGPIDRYAFYRRSAAELRRLSAKGYDLAAARQALEIYRREHGIALGPSLGYAWRRLRWAAKLPVRWQRLRSSWRRAVSSPGGSWKRATPAGGFGTVMEALRFEAEVVRARRRQPQA